MSRIGNGSVKLLGREGLLLILANSVFERLADSMGTAAFLGMFGDSFSVLDPSLKFVTDEFLEFIDPPII